jgi:hypothetical protein
MNDPFDIYIEDLFDSSIADLFQQMQRDAIELLVKDPRKFSEIVGADPAEAKMCSDLIKSSPPEKRSQFEAFLADLNIDALYPDNKQMRETLEWDRKQVTSLFRDTAIFCATRDQSNLLMWAHYAEKHRGIVLGFRPDLARDSYLRLLEPVQYTNQRPSFYGSIAATRGSAEMDEEAVSAIVHRLVYSKSTHWSYEAEERIYIPRGVAPGEPASYLSFYPEELVELYLGCRAEDDFKVEICATARTLNSQVAIYQTTLAKGSYALEFVPLASPTP